MKARSSYRLIRSGLRVWLALSGRSVRLLGTWRVPHSAAILYACRPADFTETLVLVAAFDRPLVCVVDRELLSGRPSLLQRALGMIAYDAETSVWHAALRSTTEVLATGGLVLVFAESRESAGSGQKVDALTLVHEAWANAFPEQLPLILPVDCFRPAARAQEILIHVGEPLGLDVDQDAPASLSQRQVEAALAECPNVFALDPAMLTRLMGEVERDLRERLEAAWAARPGRKQKTDGFRLSPFGVETLRQANRTEPEELVALGELSGAERETRRQWSLAQLRAEFESRRLSAVQRALGWAESVLGLPIACYGVVNHVSAALLLFVCGLLKWDGQPRPGPWLARSAIVLGCYAGQVALVDHFFGRAVAGYYAITLPVSGAYLARYWWLLQRRTRVLLAGARTAMLWKTAQNNRARLFKKLDAMLEARSNRPRAAWRP